MRVRFIGGHARFFLSNNDRESGKPLINESFHELAKNPKTFMDFSEGGLAETFFGAEAPGKPALGPVFSGGRAGRPRTAKSGFPQKLLRFIRIRRMIHGKCEI